MCDHLKFKNFHHTQNKLNSGLQTNLIGHLPQCDDLLSLYAHLLARLGTELKEFSLGALRSIGYTAGAVGAVLGDAAQRT